MMRGPDLGPIGLWSIELRRGDRAEALDTAAEMEELGFGTLWTPGGLDSTEILDDVSALLGATSKVVIATAIINIWTTTAEMVGTWWHGLAEADRARVQLGLGVSHGPLIPEYAKPLASMRTYVDALAEAGVPAHNCCIAALAPKMLELSATRTAGTHPYLVPVEHMPYARELIGPEALLAPEIAVILDSDADRARALARTWVKSYLRLPNYRNCWMRLGYSDEEITALSDRLIDALFIWGDSDRVAAGVQRYRDAGADHVAIQLIHGPQGDFTIPRAQWRELAAALL